jgi:hypothetical protein
MTEAENSGHRHDVFTGVVAAFWVRDVVNRVSPPIDRLLSPNHR